MSDRIAVDFIVAGGTALGLGHVMRSAALARAASSRGFRVRAFVAGDPVAREAFGFAAGACEVQTWTACSQTRVAPIVVLDYPERKGPWLTRLAASGRAGVVLDDLRSIGRADLSILPGLHHSDRVDDTPFSDGPDRKRAPGPPTRSRPSPARAILSGPRYSIISEAHRALPRRPRQDRKGLLLSLGGSDPHHATPVLTRLVDRVLASLPARRQADYWPRIAVLGAAFDDPDREIARTLERAGWQVRQALRASEMAECMAAPRLAVAGFGTSLVELAWHGTPFLALAQQTGDVAHASRLEARGLGLALGYAARIEPAVALPKIRRALVDEAWQYASAERAFEAIDSGLGVERILDRLAALSTARTAARDSPRESGGFAQGRGPGA